jgi:iron(III) transport system substrate-binding protein
MRRLTIALLLAALLAAAAAVSAACGATQQQRASATTTLTVYSGRDERFVKPVFDKFTELTGIELRVRYGDSAELAATLLEEGRNSPADVFFAQDAGALGAVASRGRLAVLPEGTLRRVPRRFRAPGKRWIGVTGRARVVVYNTEALTPRSLPRTIWGYTQPRWRGLVGVPPTNASFQAFVSAMRIRVGDERTRDWLLALKENGVRFYTSNSRIVSAVANREIQVGFVNHYYVYQHRELRPRDPVANHFLGKNDPGALINVAGAGVVTGSTKRQPALRLINFLLSRGMQRFFSSSPGRAEYPVVPGIRPRPGLPPLARLEGARVSLQRLGRELPRTLELLAEVGYTR